MAKQPRPPRRPPPATEASLQDALSGLTESLAQAETDATDAMRDATLLEQPHTAARMRHFRDRIRAMNAATRLLFRQKNANPTADPLPPEP